MRLGSSTDKKDSGRLHVDFAQARDDFYEWECKQRMRAREERHRRKLEEDRLRPPSPPAIMHYSEHEAALLAEKLKGRRPRAGHCPLQGEAWLPKRGGPGCLSRPCERRLHESRVARRQDTPELRAAASGRGRPCPVLSLNVCELPRSDTAGKRGRRASRSPRAGVSPPESSAACGQARASSCPGGFAPPADAEQSLLSASDTARGAGGAEGKRVGTAMELRGLSCHRRDDQGPMCAYVLSSDVCGAPPRVWCCDR